MTHLETSLFMSHTGIPNWVGVMKGALFHWCYSYDTLGDVTVHLPYSYPHLSRCYDRCILSLVSFLSLVYKFLLHKRHEAGCD